MMKNAIILISVLFLAIFLCGSVSAAENETNMVSVSSAGAQADSYSGKPAISEDGTYVAFQSYASNLVTGDTNNKYDIFVRNTNTNTTTRVSVNTDGTQGNGDSTNPAISLDGRYVTFMSAASNLVTGDDNGYYDVFVHDTISGTTTRVSVNTDGTQGNGDSTYPTISGEGRYMAFMSTASNLVTGDNNGYRDVFIHDQNTGTTTMASIATNGTQGYGGSYYPVISSDGRYVAFHSNANNLVTGDTNGCADVFVHDTISGTTTRVSVNTDGTQGDSDSNYPTISADGRYVAFTSYASNLISGDTYNGYSDVFLHDRQTGTTELISVNLAGNVGDNISWDPSISTDGRYVAFASYVNNLVLDDTNSESDVFVRDRTLGTTKIVNVDSYGTQANANSQNPSINSNGQYVAFDSFANNLVTNDANNQWDVFVHENKIIIKGEVHAGDSMQEAINIASDGDTITVYDNNGTPFTYGANISVNKKLNLIADGNVTIQSTTPGTPALTVLSGANGSNLQGFNIIAHSPGIFLENVANIIISEMNITSDPDNSNWTGIYLLNCINITIINNNITLNTTNSTGNWTGILLVNSTNCTIQNNTVNTLIGSVLNPDWCGIKLESDSSNNTLIENTLQNNGGYGLSIKGGSNNSIQSNLISGNGAGILLDDTQATVDNNTIQDHVGDGINVMNSSGNIIINNQINNSGTADGSVNAITLYQSTDNQVTNNTIVGSGINLYGSTENPTSRNIIEDNEISEHLNDPYGAIGNGIELYEADENYLNGNHIHDNEGNGIIIRNSTDNHIFGNLIEDSDDGIVLDESSNNWVYDNTLLNNNNSILIQNESDNNHIIGNTIQNSTNYGISIENSSNNLVYNNNFINNYVQAEIVSGDDNYFFKDEIVGGNYWSDNVDNYETYNSGNEYGIGYNPYYFTGGSDDYPNIRFIYNVFRGNNIQESVDLATDGEMVIVHDDQGNPQNFTENIDINNNLILKSDGEIIIQSTGPDEPVIDVSNSSNGSIIGFNISGSSNNQGVNFYNCLYWYLCNNLIYNNNNGVGIGRSNYVYVRENQLYNNSVGVAIFESYGISIYENEILNNNIGITLNDVNSTFISTNNIYDNNHEGIDLYQSHYNGIYYNTLNNNPWGIGMYQSGGNWIESNTITQDEEFRDGDTWGISIGEGNNNNVYNNNISNFNRGVAVTNSNYTEIQYNNIFNNNYGLDLYKSTHNQVTYNTIEENGAFGVALNTASDYNTITRNQVNNNGFNQTWGGGIAFHYAEDQTCTGNEVSWNTITGNNNNGIDLNQANGNLINQNTLTGNGRHGIILWGSSNNNLTYNTITDNGFGSDWGNGIFVGGDDNQGVYSNGNILNNNVIMGNQNHGIFMNYANDNIISYNTLDGNSPTLETIPALCMDHANNNYIENNIIRNHSNDNGIGMGNSNWNTIYRNLINGSYGGINVYYNSNYNQISNNIINDDGGVGILLGDGGHPIGNTISYNRLNGNYSNIQIRNSQETMVNNNIISNLENGGISVSDSPGITISSNQLTNTGYYGISVFNSPLSFILNNRLNNMDSGISLYVSPESIIHGNSINWTNWTGIDIGESEKCIITKNNITNTNNTDLSIYYSPECTLKNNSINNNVIRTHTIDIGYWSETPGDISGYRQYIDTSNTVNGKPVHYIMDASNLVIDQTWNIGFLGLVNCNNINVTGINMDNTGMGILIVGTNNTRVGGTGPGEPCNFTNNVIGMKILESSHLEIIGNNVSDNRGGIIIENGAGYNTINSNLLTNNSEGLYLSNSPYNTLFGNVLTNTNNDTLNFGVFGDEISHFRQYIDTSNTINGKSIYYLLDANNLVINQTWNPGFLGLVNCTNINITGINITNNWQGLLLAGTNNTIIGGPGIGEPCSFSYNREGIFLWGSSYNQILNNNLSNNGGGEMRTGIVLTSNSDHNIVRYNNLTENGNTGIAVENSSYNQIEHNILSSNGITVSGVSNNYVIGEINNIILNNTITNAGDSAILLDSTMYNQVLNNTLTGNSNWMMDWPEWAGSAIQIFGSKSNLISGNQIIANLHYGIHVGQNWMGETSEDNLIVSNNIIGNLIGIMIGEGTANTQIHFNRILGNINGEIRSPFTVVDAENNWWGSNDGPVHGTVDVNVDFDPWLVLTLIDSPIQISVGGKSTVTADLTHDNTGTYHDPTLGHVPDGILVTFNLLNPELGILNPATMFFVNGSASTTFTGINNGLANITATLDDEIKNTTIGIGNVNLYVTNYPWYSSVYTYDYKQQIIMLAQVNNLGNTTATGIVTKYIIGSAFKVISYNLIQPGTLEFNTTTNTFTWTIDQLKGGNNTAGGSYASFSVLLESLKTGSGGADFRLNSTIISCDQNNTGTTNTRTRNLIIRPSADIQVNQTVNNSNPQQGDYITITIKAKNNGPNNATGLNITNILPAGLYLDTVTDPNTSITASQGTYNITTGIWNIGTLNNNTEATLNLTVKVIAATGAQISNYAYRSGTPTQYDWNTANDAYNLVINVSNTDVNLYVTNYPWYSSVYTYDYKQQIIMLAQVNNLGNTTATGIVVKYIIGNAFKVISYNLIQPGTLEFNTTTNTFTWMIDKLEGGNNTAGGSYASFSVLLESLKTGSGGADFRLNSTIISCDQNNTGTTNTRTRNLIIRPSADIQVKQTISNKNPQNGDYITITIKAKNNGPNNATGLNITNILPAGLYLDTVTDPNTSITASQGTYNTTTGIWNIGTLTNNTEATLTLTVKVTATTGTTITNYAYRSGTPTQYDWNTANDAQERNIIVK